MLTFQNAINYPFSKKIDISGVPLPKIVEVLRGCYGGDPFHGDFVYPETEALDFYMSNHVVALIGNNKANNNILTTDEEYLLSEYKTNTTQAAVRAFAYMLLICSREMRHLGYSSKEGCHLETDAEKTVYDFIKQHIVGSGGVQTAIMVWEGGIDFEIGTYTTVLEKMFRYGGWGSHSFGGPAWAEVTKCLRDYVYGTLTAEMMLDTVWTLCHNNGPIFNKNMLYHNYGSELYLILDVQRAGQIPQYKWEKFSSYWYLKFLTQATDLFPSLADHPDMEQVKLLALHPENWEHIKIEKSGFKIIKPIGGSSPENLVTTEKMETDRYEQTD